MKRIGHNMQITLHYLSNCRSAKIKVTSGEEEAFKSKSSRAAENGMQHNLVDHQTQASETTEAGAQGASLFTQAASETLDNWTSHESSLQHCKA